MNHRFTIWTILSLCLVKHGQANNVQQRQVGADINTARFDQFDWKLFKTLHSSNTLNTNEILSPFGVKLVLAIIYEGSGQNASREIENIMELSEGKTASRLKIRSVIQSLQAKKEEYDLNQVTRMYIDDWLTPKERFQRILDLYYRTFIEKIKFTDSLNTVERINRWVNAATRGHIKDLVNEESVANTVVMIINAIYFKGRWSCQFSKEKTTEGSFVNGQGKSVQTEFMNERNYYAYGESEELKSKIIRLPFMGKKLTMFVLLPKSPTGLQELINKTDSFNFQKFVSEMEEEVIDLTLPKFKYDFKADLKPILQQLGIKQIFETGSGFPGITSKNNKEELVVSNLIQKSGIEVNEEGSTAYAVTEADLGNRIQSKQYTFNASHPFIFLIVDEPTNTILFIGTVVDPKLSSSNIKSSEQETSTQSVKEVSTMNMTTTNQNLSTTSRTNQYYKRRSWKNREHRRY